jgi:hypothetical protein
VGGTGASFSEEGAVSESNEEEQQNGEKSQARRDGDQDTAVVPGWLGRKSTSDR